MLAGCELELWVQCGTADLGHTDTLRRRFFFFSFFFVIFFMIFFFFLQAAAQTTERRKAFGHEILVRKK